MWLTKIIKVYKEWTYKSEAFIGPKCYDGT